jgi:hypothetical protein
LEFTLPANKNPRNIKHNPSRGIIIAQPNICPSPHVLGLEQQRRKTAGSCIKKTPIDSCTEKREHRKQDFFPDIKSRYAKQTAEKKKLL